MDGLYSRYDRKLRDGRNIKLPKAIAPLIQKRIEQDPDFLTAIGAVEGTFNYVVMGPEENQRLEGERKPLGRFEFDASTRKIVITPKDSDFLGLRRGLVSRLVSQPITIVGCHTCLEFWRTQDFDKYSAVHQEEYRRKIAESHTTVFAL
jgi:hypothetical protein